MFLVQVLIISASIGLDKQFLRPKWSICNTKRVQCDSCTYWLWFWSDGYHDIVPSGKPALISCEPLPKVNHCLPSMVVYIFKYREFLAMICNTIRGFLFDIRIHRFPLLLVFPIINITQAPTQVLESIFRHSLADRSHCVEPFPCVKHLGN